MNNQGVFIVVIGKNEGERLRTSLISAKNTGLPVVYVDSCSVDGSLELAKGLGVDAISTPGDITNASIGRNSGYSYLRNKGYDASYVMFLDGDTELAPGFIDHTMHVMEQDERIGGCCGRLRESDSESNLYRLLLDIEWYREAGTHSEGLGIVMLRCKSYEEVGGYDESLMSGADPEMYQRIIDRGYRMQTVPEPMGVHDSGMTRFSQWWMRSVKNGIAVVNSPDISGWKRRLYSAFFWGGAVPLGILVGLLYPPVAIALLALYLVQTVRIGLRLQQDRSMRERLVYGVSVMVQKTALIWGWLRVLGDRAGVSRVHSMQYK